MNRQSLQTNQRLNLLGILMCSETSKSKKVKRSQQPVYDFIDDDSNNSFIDE